MTVQPKVFVKPAGSPTRAWARSSSTATAEVWTDPLPPPHAILRQKVASCDGLVALLTDKIDARVAGRPLPA